MDPFGGSGTMGLVCRQHNRHYVLCDISQENVELASKHIFEGITSNDKKRLFNDPKIAQMELPIVMPEETDFVVKRVYSPRLTHPE